MLVRRPWIAASFYTGVRKGELRKGELGPRLISESGDHALRQEWVSSGGAPIIPGLMERLFAAAKEEQDSVFIPECEAVFAYEGRRLIPT